VKEIEVGIMKMESRVWVLGKRAKWEWSDM